MKEPKSKIYREDYWNPFIIEGNEVDSINFYKDGKVIARTNWFSGGGSNNAWKIVMFDFPLRKARLVNMDKKDAFFVKSDAAGVATKYRYDLYIPAEFVDLRLVEKKDCGVSLMCNHTCDVYSLKLTGKRVDYVKSDGDYKRVWKDVEAYEETFTCNHVFEETDEHRKCENLSKKIKEKCKLNISIYDVQTLLEHFKITEKRK